MRALSLSQPWASVVVYGPKRIENRPVQLATAARRLIGDVIALHAAKSWDADAVPFIQSAAPAYAPPDHARGAMIGSARIVDVATIEWWRDSGKLVADQERWAFGPLCILLEDVRPLHRPVPCRGMLGFWTVPAAIERAMWSTS